MHYLLMKSGTASVPRREKAIAEWRKHAQYFALAGVMIDRNTYFDELKPAMTNLKTRFWPPAGLFYFCSKWNYHRLAISRN